MFNFFQRGFNRRFTVSCLFLLAFGATANAATSDVAAKDHIKNKNTATEEISQYSNEQALAISQAAIGQSVGHYRFTSSDGAILTTKTFSGKPLIVSMIYTSCHHICPTITENLNRVVEKATQVLGEDSFNVITIGFDTHIDTPKAMAQFAKSHSSGSKNWFFLSTDAATMSALARDLGFIFSASPQGFDHMIQASILDKDSVVYRQVYGMRPQTPNFVEPLKELVFGENKSASLFSAISTKIKLFCTVYDPSQDKYYFNYSIFIGIFVALVMGIFFVRIFVREWKLSKTGNHNDENNDSAVTDKTD